jgi:hypothetical protein
MALMLVWKLVGMRLVVDGVPGAFGGSLGEDLELASG